MLTITITCISILFVVYILSKLGGQKTVKKTMPVIKLLHRNGDAFEDEWHTYIAGINFRASTSDIGGFTGWVENERENAYNSRAMAIYRADGKLLGYIPEKELSEYRAWCKGPPQPCVGIVYKEDGHWCGKVKLLRPCSEEFLQTEFSRYLRWVKENFGEEYLPSGKSIPLVVE